MAAKFKIVRQISVGLVLLGLSLLTMTLRSVAQDEHSYTLYGGAGFSPLVGDVSSRLDNGWHLTVGGGLNVTRHLAATLEYSYNGFGVSKKVLQEAQVPDGNSHLWSITVNPKIRLYRRGNFDPYVVGGVGYYRRTVEFTKPVGVPVFVFDPFFGVFFNTIVQADQILGRITQDGVGGSLGAGLDVKLRESGLRFYTEARYHYANTGSIPTRMVPVTFGIRW